MIDVGGRAMSLPRPPLLLITDRRQARRPLPDIAEAAFRAGCRWLLFRDKDLPAADRAAIGRDLVALARARNACFSVSDDAQLAAELGADGLHVAAAGDVTAARRVLGETVTIGRSAHSLNEIRRSEDQGADYVTLSPIYATASKPGYGPAMGPGELARAVQIVSIPVIALAGITSANAAECLAAGAAGVAVMGPVMRADDPGLVVAELVAALAGHGAASIARD